MSSTRVLIVDDSPANLKLARITLQGAGFEVSTACDGDEALQKALSLAPDVVLLDISMPRRDGLAVTAALRGIQAQTFTAAAADVEFAGAAVEEEQLEHQLRAGVAHMRDRLVIRPALPENASNP